MAKARFALGGAAVLLFLGQSSVALADCYVYSQSGSDTNDGQSETTPWKSQTAVASSCTVVRYKRGSVFNQALRIISNAKTYTNYGSTSDPLPQFVVPHTASSGSIVSSYQGGLTIDGLYLGGSHGDGTMSGLIKGVCVMLGSGSKLLNSEVANCDIGIMLSGTGSLIQGNYVHDLTMAVDAGGDSGVDPNAVGGAEGIFINGSNNEVSYNSFVNCSSAAAWTGGSCDGGATEVTVGAGATLSGVKIHHNLSYNSCGFFEVSSGGSTKGTFADSEFSYNVSIDSGWMMLLQVNNTNLSNIQWNNNTVVQHSGSTNAGMLTTVFTGTSSGQTGGSLAAGAVSLTNNFIILDGVRVFGTAIDAAITQTTNLIVDTASGDPGVVNVKGTTAADFDLTSSSPAVNAGTTIASLTQDYLDRAVPDSSGTTDIGAFEYGSSGSGAGGRTNWGGSSSGGNSATSGSANTTGGSAGQPSAETCSCRLAGGSSGSGRGLAGLLGLGAAVLFWRRRPGKVVR
jgi:MYXO-CTERM domain-containing protein